MVINGVEHDVEFTIDTSDAQYVTITAVKGDETVTFTRGGVSTSTDNANNKQIRIEGSFPVGTKSDPVYYTVTLSKTITVEVDGVSYQVPVTLTVTTHYWDSGNCCPGLGEDWPNSDSVSNRSGIDLKLENGSGSTATVGTLTIQKTVEGYELTADKTYTFEVYSVKADGTEEKYGNDVTVTVPAGRTMASVMLTKVPFGKYKIVEKESGKEITGYTCTTTYTTGQEKTISKDDLSEIFAVENEYEKTTSSLTIIKAVTDDNDNGDPVVTNINYTFTVQGPDAVKNQTVGNYTFDGDGKTTVTITGANRVTIAGLPLGEYTVTEDTSADEPTGYDFDSTGSRTTATAELTAAQGGTATITNNYKLKQLKVTVLKDVTGNMGDTNKGFAFTATGVTDSFTLKDKDQNPNNKQEITVSYGDSFTVTETDANSDGYTTTVKVGDEAVNTTNGSYTIDEVTEDVTITFVNEKNVIVPNGLTHTITPYIIMVAAAAGAGVYLVVRRRPRGRHCK